MTAPGGHPGPEELEGEEPAESVQVHLEGCAACRMDRRILQRAWGPAPDAPGLASARPSLERVRQVSANSLLARWRSSRSHQGMGQPAQVDILPAGSTIGLYRVVSLLGRGGAAAVYRAVHISSGQSVALKVLTQAPEELRRRMQREGRVQQAIRHPGIVSVLDTVEDSGRLGLVLELVEGPSLDAVLREEQLPLAVADAIVLDVLAAMGAAHAEGLVHRDLKPANVLLTPDGDGLSARVADFGLARVLGTAFADGLQTGLGAVLGTPSFMAPEQVAGSADVDARADVYALGALLYELVTGVRCFGGVDAADIAARVVHGNYLPPEQIVGELPVRVCAAIAAALRVGRSERPANAHELLALWTGGLAPDTLRPHPWDHELVERILDLRVETPLGDAGAEPRPPTSAETFAWQPHSQMPDELPSSPDFEPLDVEELLPSMLHPGQRVDHFELIRLLGRGGMGEVYLARDVHLGRKVALKLVRAEVVANPGVRERFVREARVTARLSHPNIVTIYEVGEVLGRPYVALEYLAGESLRDRMHKEALGTRQALRIGLAVARALMVAHDHDVMHRDLKPENILLENSGGVRVVDFGLARRIELDASLLGKASAGDTAFRSAVGQIVGTPAYMAPEQWLAKPTSAATDVWALGLLLYELLAGERPFTTDSVQSLMAQVVGPHPAPRLAGAPSEVADLVARCLAKDPALRPDAADVAEALEVHLEGQRVASTDEGSPFRGLLPFDERHAAVFLGREAETAEMVERLRDETVLPVVGPSGAGKSSLVAAGVVPRLREQADWLVVRLRPGADPFGALVARLERGEPSASSSRTPLEQRPRSLGLDLRTRLEQAPAYLAWVLARLAAETGRHVLLYVDQLEELYTMVEDEAVQRDFVRAICGAADDPGGPVRVVFTVRDDFLVRLAETAEARQALAHLVVLRSPGPPELREILLRSVQRSGYAYEDEALVDQMIDAVRGEPASLPILQFAGAQLWQHRDRVRKVLSRAAYECIGGVEGALAQHADAVIDGMATPDARLARIMLLRLVTAEGTRRILSRRRLVEDLGPDAAEVLARLVAGRIVLVGRARNGDEAGAQVELVHESLIVNWERLARWLDESRTERSFLLEVDQAATLWSSRGRPDAEVWTGEALWVAQRKAERLDAVPVEVTAFLDAGSQVERRSRRRRRAAVGGVVGALCIVAIAAVGTSLLIRNQSIQIDDQKRRAVDDRAATQLDNGLAALADGRQLEGRTLLRESLEVADSPVARSLWRRLGQDPVHWVRHPEAATFSLGFSPDGDRFVIGSSWAVLVYDVATAEVSTLRGHYGTVYCVDWSRDGHWVASGDTRGEVRVWDMEEGTSVTIQTGELANAVAFSPDASQIAVAGNSGVIQLIDRRAGRQNMKMKGHKAEIWVLAYAPDGRWLASASQDGTVRVWDTATGEAVRVLQGDGGQVGSMTWHPDGTRLLAGYQDGKVRIWDPTTGELHGELVGHTLRVQNVSVAPGKQIAVSVASDRSLRVWDLATMQQIDALYDLPAETWVSRFSPDESKLIVADNDATLTVLRLNGSRILGADKRAAALTGGHEQTSNGAVFSPDGTKVASSSIDGTVRVWDFRSGRTTAILRGHQGRVSSARFTPDGQTVISSGFDKTIRLWDAETGRQQEVLVGHQGRAGALAVSRDGRTLASTGTAGVIRLWDLENTGTSRILARHPPATNEVSFTADGRRLVSTGSDFALRFWDVRTSASVGVIELPGSASRSAVFSPDGSLLLAAGTDDGVVTVWDSVTRKLKARYETPAGVNHLAISPDGTTLALPGSDTKIRIFDLASGEIRATLRGHEDNVMTADFSPDGRSLVTADLSGQVRMWDVGTGHPYWRAPLVRPTSGEVFTQEGWLVAATGRAVTTGGERWRQAVADHALVAAESSDGAVLCLGTHDHAVELWDVGGDRVVLRNDFEDIDALRALPNGCLVLSDGDAVLLGRDGNKANLRSDVTAVDWSGGDILLAGDGKVFALSQDGQQRASYTVDVMVSALTWVGDRLAVGFEQGDILLYAIGSDGVSATTTLREPATRGVKRIIAGPEGTLVAGFGDGVVGLWSTESGEKLDGARLHGIVSDIVTADPMIYATSEVGQYLAWDYSVFTQDYCQLLRTVWQQVPVVHDGSRIVRAGPPAGHRCAEH